MNGESGNDNKQTCANSSESEGDYTLWGRQSKSGSWFWRHGDVQQNEWFVTVKDKPVDSQATVTTEEEWVSWRGRTEIKSYLGRWVKWLSTRKELGFNVFIYVEQWSDFRIDITWCDLGSLTRALAWEFWMCWSRLTWVIGTLLQSEWQQSSLQWTVETTMVYQLF